MQACAEIERLIAAIWEDVKGTREELRTRPNAAECVEEGMRRSVSDENWRSFQAHVLAAAAVPTRELVPLLCEALDHRVEAANPEDVVDLLLTIRDPRSVPCLSDAMWWHPDNDEFHQLALKCVNTLAAIGTPEARQALEDAAATGPERVREEATAALAWLDARS